MTVAELAQFLLGAVLLGAAVAKLVAGEGGRAALRSYGITSSSARAALWAVLIAVEAGLGIAVAAGVPVTAEIAAGMLTLFAHHHPRCGLRGPPAPSRHGSVD